MLKDVNTTAYPSYTSSMCGGFVEFKGSAVFCGANWQLWRTDGTAAGTKPMTTAGGAIIDYAYAMTPAGKYLYFSQSDQLWLTDGTAAGTRPVRDAAGNRVAFDGADHVSRAVGNQFYFATYNGLWKTDGTGTGTVKLKDFSGGYTAVPHEMVNVNGTLFYTTLGELWKSDGTSSGTVRVAQLAGTAGNPNWSGDTNHLTAVGTSVYFSRKDVSGHYDLWKSDGTTAGTAIVADDIADANIPIGAFRAFNGELFFMVDATATKGSALWRSNGTKAGTAPVATFPNAQYGTGSTSTVLGQRLLFTVPNGSTVDLWVTDGTEAQTKRIGQDFSGREFATYGGEAYFAAANLSGLGFELWKTNGTAAGTTLVRDIAAGEASSNPGYFGLTSRGVVFQADKGKRFGGPSIWTSQGTTESTKLVKDVSQFTAGSYPSSPVVVGDEVYFFANQTVQPVSRMQWELWKTNGTTAGTQKVLNLIPTRTYGEENFGGEYAGMVNFDGVLYVSGRDSTGWGLWRTDGTADGTTKLTGVLPNGSNAIMTHLWVVDHKLYFFAATSNGMGLWRLGLNEATATLVKDGLKRPQWFGRANGAIAFLNDRHELWRSDGTPAGTRMVTSIAIDGFAANDVAIDRPQAFGNRVLFRVQWGETCDFDCYYENSALWIWDWTDKGSYALYEGYAYPGPVVLGNKVVFVGNGLFVSDGTVAGTKQIAAPGSVRNLVAVGTVAYADVDYPDYTLWRTDGSAAGTYPLKTNVALSSHVAGFHGTAYFTAEDRSAPRTDYGYPSSLYKSDGTVAGTTAVKPGLWGLTPLDSSGRFVFHSGLLGDQRSIGQYWTTDGTEAGTVQVSNIKDSGGYYDSGYWDGFGSPVRIQNKLILPRHGNQKGVEPWVFELP